jgi:uncharacterized protein (DUF2236 family)
MDPDPGLFGPSSITWRIHGDPVLWVAGLRALYLQALHPLAVRGVYQHSDFSEDPWGRLLRTADYVGAITFGTSEEAEQAAARVRAIHRALAGSDPRTGRSFRLDDPELLRWIHCCEVDSFLTTVQRAGAGITSADADRYLTEQRTSARLIGLDPETVPSSTAEMRAYFDRLRPELSATADAWRAFRFVLVPPMPTRYLPARPAWLSIAGLAVALLPRWARRMYGLPGLPTTDVTASLGIAGLRAASQLLPAGMREGPHLRAARQRLGDDAIIGSARTG